MPIADTCCPTCGHALEGDEFVWDEEARVFVAGGVSVRFTKTEAWIMGALWRSRHRGGIDGLSALAGATYMNDPDGGPLGLSGLSVMLMRIREKLEPTGYTVPTGHGRPKRAFQIIKASEAA